MNTIILTGNPLSTQMIYQYFCRGKFGKFYMTARGKQVKKHYQEEVAKQYKGEVLTDDIEIEINLYFKDKRRRDVDNYNKLILDSLEGIVYKDDKQIQRLLITKDYSPENPRAELTFKIIK